MPAMRLRPTGTPVANFSALSVPPPDYQRPAANLSLAVEPATGVTRDNAGDLLLAAGSRIGTDPGGTVTLTAPDPPAGRWPDRRAGRDHRPATGDARRRRWTRATTPPRASFVGSTALLRADWRRASLQPSDIGLRSGRGSGRRHDQSRPRSGASCTWLRVRTLDVSGTATELDLPVASAGTGGAPYERRTVGSRGGSIDILAPEGFGWRQPGRALRSGPAASRPEGGSLSIGVSRLRGFQPPIPSSSRPIRRAPADHPWERHRARPAATPMARAASIRPRRQQRRFRQRPGPGRRCHRLWPGHGLDPGQCAPARRHRRSARPTGVSSVGSRPITWPSGRACPASGQAAPTTGRASLQASAGLIDFFGNSVLQGFDTADLRPARTSATTGLPTGPTSTARLGGSLPCWAT